jgi:RNA polymerase-binding transcription factor DksA
MKKSKRAMRRAILSRLFENLQEHYALDYPREWFVDGQLSLHEIDAILAFKGEASLDELRQALDRLEEGTFGICISCKGEISQHDLDLDPVQRICMECEKQLTHHMLPEVGAHASL